MKGLSVIVPVKNPEPYLEQLTKNIYRTLKEIPHEILIQREVGLTNAVIKGVERSQFSLIAVMDADGSHLPEYLIVMAGFFSLNNSVDLVIGSKVVGFDETPFYRRLISKFFRFFARFMLNLKVSDPMSGFVLGRRELFLKLRPSDDYKFLLQLLCLKPHVVEIPIVFFARKSGKSKSSLRTGLRTLKLILKLWWRKYA